MVRLRQQKETALPKNKLYAHVILDRSGSMATIQAKTVDAFNEYLNGLAADDNISARVSLTIFDSTSIDLLRDNVKAKDCPKLTSEEYQPRASTPLYDAIGKTVAKIDTETRREGENVALVILTDGMENASTEYTKESVKALLDGRQKTKNWLVIYLGANQDAFAEGSKFGASASSTMVYDTHNIGATMKAASESTMRYAATASLASASFTPTERASAMGKKTNAKDPKSLASTRANS